MPRTVAIGVQDFETIIQDNCFYIDKTGFIKEWWDSKDHVTLITRPRRFGKTLNMNMLERFFDVKHQGQGQIFKNLDIWKEEKYRKLQGTYPVLFLSLANIKEQSRDEAVESIKTNIAALYNENRFLLEEGFLNPMEQEQFTSVTMHMSDVTAAKSIYFLCSYLNKYYNKRVIILLDEYDTPMQEAYMNGFWLEFAAFTRNFFNNTFKTNPYMERAVLTGITRISKESMFSDLNNMNVASVISNEYSSCFGFTEEEVFCAMDEFGMANREEVKRWYDGFNIGTRQDIYNPWSVINYLDKRQLKPYWANTSSNGLAAKLIRGSSRNIKMQFESLLSGKSIENRIDEEIVFNRLNQGEDAIWSLLLASGYLKASIIHDDIYMLELTNYEVRKMFGNMVHDWFSENLSDYNDFIKALLRGDKKEMNAYMSRVSLSMFSSFDGGNHPSGQTNPERFYHGFVLGLLVDLTDQYEVKSNRESGFGRYDVMLKPRDKENDGIILEFKIYDPTEEGSSEETVHAALEQIEKKRYEQELLDCGIAEKRIRKYGFAFCGKEVLIG